MAIDIFETRTMLRLLQKLRTPTTFLRDRFFPLMENSKTEHVDIPVEEEKGRLAPFTDPHADPTLVERQGWSMRTFKPPYIKMQMPCFAEDALALQPGQHIYSEVSGLDSALQVLAKDLWTLERMITRREEWMSAKAIETGKIVFTGDGVSKEIDFSMKPSHIIAHGELEHEWNSSDCDIVGLLRTWYDLCGDDSGINPDTLVLGKNAANEFYKNAKILSMLDNRRLAQGQVNPKLLPNGVIYMGDLLDPFLEVYRYNGSYWDADLAANVPYVPPDKIFMGSSQAENAMHYGAIKDVRSLASVRFWPKTYIDEKKGAQFLVLQSAPLAALHNADAFLVAEVLTPAA